ncbi:MAG: hypothetical protein KAX64_04745, partial [Chromatiaceae bacterium]|nr:hypothetical protein [Chromatiaceae bacterium]
MRPTLLLVCALTILLAACGSSSRQDTAGSPSAGAYARPASGDGRLRGDYANYPAAQAFVDRMTAEGFDRAQVADWLSR